MKHDSLLENNLKSIYFNCCLAFKYHTFALYLKPYNARFSLQASLILLTDGD